jgi:sodium/bile acid cotransporter 7
MSLKSRVLAQAATRLPLHILIQVLSLGLTPAIGYGIACAMRKAPWINQDLVSGFIVSGHCSWAGTGRQQLTRSTTAAS